MLTDFLIPAPIPTKLVPGYQMPANPEQLLSWEFVTQQMEQSRVYWLNTLYADGRPHAVPVWGIWHKNRVHFDGSPKTGWARNLLRNPQITVHLPSGDKVVIIEGHAHMLEDEALTLAEWQTLDSLYQSKYAVDNGSPYWYVHPTKVIAWNGEDLRTMTRWVFPPT